jgi:hypothetical protein
MCALHMSRSLDCIGILSVFLPDNLMTSWYCIMWFCAWLLTTLD